MAAKACLELFYQSIYAQNTVILLTVVGLVPPRPGTLATPCNRLQMLLLLILDCRHGVRLHWQE